ncbi:Sphingosine kinase 1 [Hypsibius exemplaris]|uniref:Sphingosine kinase 1 n=1 Tax=Hypsibius exemplaris TaxID=2072580 RepID=A0A9X6RKV3_HYPEX|nr:Sphingosine kinase 1 [Hypsibius exemplaris]
MEHRNPVSATSETSEAILCGNFSLSGSRKLHEVLLLTACIKYLPLGARTSKTKVIPLDDVIGVQCMKGSTNADTKAYLTLYLYPRGRSLTGSPTAVRHRSVVVFGLGSSHVFTENLETAHVWRQAIRGIMRPIASRRHFSAVWMVVINPSGGQGKAVRMFQERVGPILAEADIAFEVVVSEKLGHITGLARKLDLDKYSAIVIISGDGLIHEVINGLMTRPDWNRAIQTPLGLIPGGSGNALAASVHEACGETFTHDFPKHAALLLTKSIPVPLDLIYLETPSEERYAFLSIGWGIIADIDIESEKFRVLGETRFTVGGLQRLVGLRLYNGTLSYLPADASTPATTALYDDSLSTQSLPKPATDLLVPLSSPVPTSWTVVDGDFVSVYLASTSRLGVSNVGIPWAKLDDGLVYLFWVRGGAPKSAVASFLLNLGSGDHLKSQYVEMAAVRAFRLEPREKDGILTVDGERIQYGPIQGQVLPSLGRVMSRQPTA